MRRKIVNLKDFKKKKHLAIIRSAMRDVQELVKRNDVRINDGEIIFISKSQTARNE